MIETSWVDIAGLLGSAGVYSLSDKHDSHWAGVVHLSPGENLNTHTSFRNDLYILKGSISEYGHPFYGPGTFITRGSAHFIAGNAGVMFFAYREPTASYAACATLHSNTIEWRRSGMKGLKVATLLESSHTLKLVFWGMGTRVPFHNHPLGEEIFVLSGELKDERGRHPPGTWQRFYPGAGHSPYVDIPSLVLLRNGHLDI